MQSISLEIFCYYLDFLFFRCFTIRLAAYDIIAKRLPNVFYAEHCVKLKIFNNLYVESVSKAVCCQLTDPVYFIEKNDLVSPGIQRL